MPTTKQLPKRLVYTVHQALDSVFDRLKVQALGPGHAKDKRLVMGFDRWLSLPGVFEQAAKEEGSDADPDLLESALRSAANYLDAAREQAKARVVNEINSKLRESGTGKLDHEEFEDSLRSALVDVFDQTATKVHRIIDTEASHVKNLGMLDGIQQANAARGVDDPVVYFIIVRDGVTCEECIGLHTLDGGKPRVWKLSDVGHGYHKRGDDHPKLGGLHPHCRCIMATLLPGFGFNDAGRVTYVGPGHDEYGEQHGEVKDLKKAAKPDVVHFDDLHREYKHFRIVPSSHIPKERNEAGHYIFTPRAPEISLHDENSETPRVSVAPTIDECCTAIQGFPLKLHNHGDGSTRSPEFFVNKRRGYHVFGLREIAPAHVPNEALKDHVPDWDQNRESWYTQPVAMEHLGVIAGNSTYHVARKKLTKSEDAVVISIPYMHRVSSLKTGRYGEQFGQTYEPQGEYMTPLDEPLENPETVRGDLKDKTFGKQWFEHGTVHFANPVRVPHTFENSWKKRLSAQFGGKTGAKLTAALTAAGHDGIIAHDEEKGHLVEVVNLAGRKDVTHPLPDEALKHGRAGLPPKGAKKSEPLEKMALADIPKGPKVKTPPGTTRGLATYDYSHLLTPEHRGAGYSLFIGHRRPSRGDFGFMQAQVVHQGACVGEIRASYSTPSPQFPDVTVHINRSEMKEPHRHQGIGTSMYEALLAHSKNHLGATSVTGEQHSTHAHAVHQKLAAKHGLTYSARDEQGNSMGDGAFDNRYGSYDYALKSEEPGAGGGGTLEKMAPHDDGPPDFLRDGDAAWQWAQENVADLGADDDDDDDDRAAIEEELRDRAASYSSLAHDAHAQNAVTIHRAVRVPHVNGQPQINWNQVGKAWSFKRDGAGVQGSVPYDKKTHDLRDVVLTARVHPKHIDWPYGFTSYMYYGDDQCEASLGHNAPVEVTHVNDQPLPKPQMANTGNATEVWEPPKK